MLVLSKQSCSLECMSVTEPWDSEEGLPDSGGELVQRRCGAYTKDDVSGVGEGHLRSGARKVTLCRSSANCLEGRELPAGEGKRKHHPESPTPTFRTTCSQHTRTLGGVLVVF